MSWLAKILNQERQKQKGPQHKWPGGKGLPQESPGNPRHGETGEQFDHGIPNGNGTPTPAAAPPQQQPAENRHIVVPGEAESAPCTVGTLRFRRRKTRPRNPPNADVGEAPEKSAENENQSVRGDAQRVYLEDLVGRHLLATVARLTGGVEKAMTTEANP